MRVISGIYKGRKLKSPPKKAKIRPTTDRVKETLFNILANRIDFEEAKVLDLFCGTGSFGIECLSRGSQDVTFVDNDIRLVNENLELISANADTVKRDAISYLKSTNEKYDVVFADPPYDYAEYDKLTEYVRKLTGLFLLEHSSKLIFDNTASRKDFGDTSVSFFTD